MGCSGFMHHTRTRTSLDLTCRELEIILLYLWLTDTISIRYVCSTSIPIPSLPEETRLASGRFVLKYL